MKLDIISESPSVSGMIIVHLSIIPLAKTIDDMTIDLLIDVCKFIKAFSTLNYVLFIMRHTGC